VVHVRSRIRTGSPGINSYLAKATGGTRKVADEAGRDAVWLQRYDADRDLGIVVAAV
jgi:hypothetical protein